MVTEAEISKLWESLPKKTRADAIVTFYRLAHKAGHDAGISAIEKELLSDSTLEGAVKPFGWGRGDKRATITLRAVMREAIRIAKEKTGNQD